MASVRLLKAAQLSIIFLHLLTSVRGFNVPSPIDIHSITASVESLQHFSCHIATTGGREITEVMNLPTVIEIQDHVTAGFHTLYASVKQATVARRLDNALAGIVAEAAAGATGALISRKTTAAMIGGKKRDSLETKMKTTGAFFSARVGAEALARTLGIPRPISLLLATTFGSLVSMSVKAKGRFADDKISAEKKSADFTGRFVGANTNDASSLTKPTTPRLWTGYYCGDGEFIINMDPSPLENSHGEHSGDLIARSSISNPSESVPLSEVTGDVGKWMIFDYLLANSGISSRRNGWTERDTVALNVLFGAVAAVAGKHVQNLTPSKGSQRIPTKTEGNDFNLIQTALEGGVLFGTYRSTLSFLNSVVPDDWNIVFPFEFALESVEKMLP